MSRYIGIFHKTFITEHLFDFLGGGVAIPLTCSARRRVAAFAAFARRRYNGCYTSQAHRYLRGAGVPVDIFIPHAGMPCAGF